MLTSYFKNKKWTLWAYGGLFLIIILLISQTYLDVLFNAWYRDFYDLLQTATERDISEFWDSIIKFLYIALPYVTLFAFTNWFTRLWAFRWREAITFSYMPYWKSTDAKVEGASQRIQEDCKEFARIVESIGLQVVKAIMTVIAFVPILWILSTNVVVPFLKNISGSLVWVSLLLSFGGIIISWFVGIKLPGLEYNNQKVEAAFRKELVYGEDDRTNYAGINMIIKLFTGVKFNYHRLFLHYGYFDLWSIWYRQLFVIVPFLIMAPGLFTAAYTLGIMMQVVNAFGEVKDAFSVFLYNWTRITELRSIYKRLTEFEKSIGYKNPDIPSPDIVRS